MLGVLDLGGVFGWMCGSLFGLAMLALYVFVIIWVFWDAEARGKSGCLVAILVTLISWPLGLIVWLIFRPAEQESTERE